MLQAARTLDKGADSKHEAFKDNTASVFQYVSELELDQTDLYTTYYIPLFAALAGSEHFDTWCRYVRQNSDEQSATWVAENQEALSFMFDWLEALNLEPGAGSSSESESE